MDKPKYYLETEHLQALIDNTQDSKLWGFMEANYDFREGTVDDRTGEIWCRGRDDYDKMLTTYSNDGKEMK